MQTHGNLTASYLWQPGEFARRVLGERPSPVPPTRDLWPPQQPLSISTLQVAYLQNEPYNRRAATLPSQPYVPTTEPVDREYVREDYSRGYPREHRQVHRPRVCTIGTNTDPPPTIFSRLRLLIKKEETPIGYPPPGRLTAVPRETAIESNEENKARRAINGIKRAFTGAKYRIAPGTETVDSPKIVYHVPKPGDRMTTTFGARESRSWCKLPSRADCGRKLRGVGSWCHPRRPARRQPDPPRLQITQV